MKEQFSKGKLSIIIPCYKANEFLLKIANDILNQNFINYEAIFVDDGDYEQNEVLQKVVSLNSKFIVLHKENGGCSSARNAGLEIASGEWIVFVDPDDRIESYYLSALYNSVKKESSDLGVGGYRTISVLNQEQHKIIINKDIVSRSPLQFSDFFNYIENRTEYRSVWAKIYKSSIIKNYNIRFDENYKIAEDWKFNLEYYHHVKYATIVEYCGYTYYMFNPNSVLAKYVDTFDVRMECIDLITSLHKLTGRDEVLLNNERNHNLARLYIDLIKNLFCTRMHPCLNDAKKIISNELLANKEMMDAFMSEHFVKFSDRLQQKIIKSKNISFIVYAHFVLYKINSFIKRCLNLKRKYLYI